MTLPLTRKRYFAPVLRYACSWVLAILCGGAASEVVELLGGSDFQRGYFAAGALLAVLWFRET